MGGLAEPVFNAAHFEVHHPSWVWFAWTLRIYLVFWTQKLADKHELFG